MKPIWPSFDHVRVIYAYGYVYWSGPTGTATLPDEVDALIDQAWKNWTGLWA